MLDNEQIAQTITCSIPVEGVTSNQGPSQLVFPIGADGLTRVALIEQQQSTPTTQINNVKKSDDTHTVETSSRSIHNIRWRPRNHQSQFRRRMKSATLPLSSIQADVKYNV